MGPPRPPAPAGGARDDPGDGSGPDPGDAPEWARVRLRSVGVDIGSATSHLVFSEITMEKVGQRFVPVERIVTYESPILLTPYRGEAAIDVPALLRFIEEQFAAAGVNRADIGCGAVILTGTALDRVNARVAADLFAGQAGRFVAVSAGDGLEAVLAAHGSGAVARSAESAGTVLNIDIGGGTTKFALCRAGAVTATAAIDVGARLIVVDARDRVVRLEPAAARIAAHLRLRVSVGARLAVADHDAIVAHLAGEILAAAGVRGDPGSWLLRTPALPPTGAPVVVVSGGVAEYLNRHGRMQASTSTPVPPTVSGAVDDLGPALATALGAGLDAVAGISVRPAARAIRATALGAALFTVQLSGDTIHLSRPDLLPLRDVPVAVLAPLDESVDADRVAAGVRHAIGRAAARDPGAPLAVAVRWTGSATRDRLRTTARGIVAGVEASDVTGALVLVCDDDIGRLLGRHVAALLPPGRDVASVDGVDLRDLDFIDVASPVPRTAAVPVTVKSLVFAPAPAPDPDGGPRSPLDRL